MDRTLHTYPPPGPATTPVPGGPDWRSDRAAFWARSLRGWDVAFYALWALGVASYLFERPEAGLGLGIALATFATLLVAYVVVGRRAATTGSRPLAMTYVVVMIVCVGAVVSATETGSLLLFIAYSQVWYFAETRRQGVVLTVLLTAVVFGTIAAQSPFDDLSDAAPLITQAGIAIAFSVLLGLWVTQVAEQSEDRAELLARLEEAQAEAAASHHAAGVLAERERMAQEIHDTLAQGFTSVVMLAQTAAADLRRERPDDAAARLALIERTARENLAEARALVAAAAPVGLAESTLTEALERLATRFGEETGVEVRVVADHAALADLSREREVILLRAAQEALSNVRRHAGATRVSLVLGAAPDGGVSLEVADDGRGMAPAAVEGFGLRGMRERVTTGGGALAVTSDVGLGTRVQVTMPVGAEEAEPEPGEGDDAPAAGGTEEVR
ncbi:sensor histidine kinase [Actinotalea fermentans]|nr:sensor histidine kinase [Actinotalea fermentans]